jgi:hypothetical protein
LGVTGLSRSLDQPAAKVETKEMAAADMKIVFQVFAVKIKSLKLLAVNEARRLRNIPK